MSDVQEIFTEISAEVSSSSHIWAESSNPTGCDCCIIDYELQRLLDTARPPNDFMGTTESNTTNANEETVHY